MRQKLIKLSLLLIIPTLMSACTMVPSAGPTPYKAATGEQGYGYSSEQLSESRYRVVFKATESTPADLVQQFSLLRAAEIAQDKGFTYLAVLKTDVEKKAAIGRKVVDASNSAVFPPEQQCTMSGCTEPARATPVQDNTVTVQTGPMENVYYSIVVSMAKDKVSAGTNALSVQAILADRPDRKKSG
ncbi:CC0125/CC1285 family lipoprotein [Alteromonas sp. CYL-A6]|uniref:CC0125/CC1285 family lipoprotein n=1 Tax=Alteromonas nitratireducens TaxID=3390813 RepID=UPI0034A823CF